MKNLKNNNETEYKVLNTTTGTYRMVFSDDEDRFLIKKNGIVLRRFELGYSNEAYNWLKNMKEMDELENENSENRDLENENTEKQIPENQEFDSVYFYAL